MLVWLGHVYVLNTESHINVFKNNLTKHSQ